MVNSEAPGVMAAWAVGRGVPLIHFSTDYVFGGKGEPPWREDSPMGPLSVYGASKLAGEEMRGKRIAVLGLTFKPNTDDMRDASSIPLVTALQDMGAEIRVFDPAGMNQARRVFENVTFCDNAYDCATGAHALVIVTEWEQFRALDLEELASIMASSVIVDLRNIYSPEE